jgi:hypothetical protein
MACVQQLKSLERSFDELMRENLAGCRETYQPAAPEDANDGFDDFLSGTLSGAPRNRLAASRYKDA